MYRYAYTFIHNYSNVVRGKMSGRCIGDVKLEYVDNHVLFSDKEE